MSTLLQPIIFLDTTLRDGELMPGITFDLAEKLQLACWLDEAGVDVIEISYPGQSKKDFAELSTIAPLLKNAIACGLANSREAEILAVAKSLKKAQRGRIHLYTNINLPASAFVKRQQTLLSIQYGVTLARNFCDDVEWTAFDATRSDFDFLTQAVEVALGSGATTLNIPDSLGQAMPADFCQLIERLFDQVPQLEDVIVSVHCHDDLGQALNNSLAGLAVGVRQIECSLKGLGARRGNAALEQILPVILQKPAYQTQIQPQRLEPALNWLSQKIRLLAEVRQEAKGKRQKARELRENSIVQKVYCYSSLIKYYQPSRHCHERV